MERNHKATYYHCSHLGHQKEVTFVGGIPERRLKSEPFVLVSFAFVGLYLLGKEGGRKEGTTRGGVSCRELAKDQVMCCVTYQVSGEGREMNRGG